jgi:hypothetical protein
LVKIGDKSRSFEIDEHFPKKQNNKDMKKIHPIVTCALGRGDILGQSEPSPTHSTIHWMSVITQDEPQQS